MLRESAAVKVEPRSARRAAEFDVVVSAPGPA
jgi:hypothetical protein